MKWEIPSTNPVKKIHEWHEWFAWYPVIVSHAPITKVWLEKVLRKKSYHKYSNSSKFTYKNSHIIQEDDE